MFYQNANRRKNFIKIESVIFENFAHKQIIL